MLQKSASQKTLRDVMLEERTTTTMASRLLSPDASSGLSNPLLPQLLRRRLRRLGAVLWESAPGTPKNDAISSTALPPLTPPPSYYSKATCRSKSSKKLLSSSSKPASFVHSMFRRSQTMPSPSRPKESVVVDQQCGRRKRLVPPSPRSSFSSTSRGEDEEVGDGAQDGRAASPTSTLCFRARHSGQPGSGGGARRLLASVLGGHGNAAS